MSISSLKSTFLRPFLAALSLGIGVILVLILIFSLGTSLFYINRIFPGVSMNGISLSGMTVEQATQVIGSSYSFPQTGHILIKDGDSSWVVSPAQMGVYLDPEASARNALSVGREGSLFTRTADLFSSFLFGYSSSPTFIFNQRTALLYLLDLSKQIDQPVKEASLSIQNAEVVVVQGQPGRLLDIAASLSAISNQIQKMQDGTVNLVVTEAQPKVLDVSQQGEQVKSMLEQPFTLSLPSDGGSQAGPWVIQPTDLAGLLTFNQKENGTGTQYEVGISRPLMAAYLQSIENEIDQAPQNTRFTFNDDTHQLEVITNAVVGRNLDIENSITAVNDALLNGEHAAVMKLTLTQPQVTDSMTGTDLGITEEVYEYTSYFRSSSDDRVQNIKTGAAKFHGLLIAPGATLSMSDVLGNISLDNGYAEAPIILGDETIQGVGGGICQVSTTLFRTVFFSGYPIVERHAHSYRVNYYEQTASGHDQDLAGLDATVFVPLVDFKFTNDTPYWLLMETYVSTRNYSLTWKFYSTKDGRIVNWQTSGVQDVVDPPDPLYRENPDLPAGTIKKVDYAVAGATVEVNRTVTRGGSIIDTDHIVTHYDAWRAIYEYGPGTENIPTPTSSH